MKSFSGYHARHQKGWRQWKKCGKSSMATTRLPQDFKEFLRLLSENQIEYLLIGGYAVGYYGYPRATADLDIWISMNPKNAKKIVAALIKFGFGMPELTSELFLQPDRIVRMGIPPIRIEIATTISGVEFYDCYSRRTKALLDGVEVNMISLDDLLLNKKASGRYKDLDDLEHLS